MPNEYLINNDKQRNNARQIAKAFLENDTNQLQIIEALCLLYSSYSPKIRNYEQYQTRLKALQLIRAMAHAGIPAEIWASIFEYIVPIVPEDSLNITKFLEMRTINHKVRNSIDQILNEMVPYSIMIKEIITNEFCTAFITRNNQIYRSGEDRNIFGLDEKRIFSPQGDPHYIINMKKIGIHNKKIKQILPGLSSMLLTESGEVVVGGINEYGELGLGYVTARGAAERLQLLTIPWKKIIKILAPSTFLTEDNSTKHKSVFVCGLNDHGQLGLGDTQNRLIPTEIPLSRYEEIVNVTTGHAHSIFLTTDDKVFSCGENYFGQLGLMNTPETHSPKEIKIPNKEKNDKIVQVSGGRYHTILLTASGKVYSFGLNASGQL